MIWYNTALQALGDGDIDLGAGTFKVALCSSAYTADTSDSGDDFFDDVTGVLTTATLSGVTWNSARELSATTPVSFNDPGSGTATQMVLYKDTGVASTSPLIGYDNTATNLPIVFDGTDDAISFGSYILKLGCRS